jgi:hypothetical protein
MKYMSEIYGRFAGYSEPIKLVIYRAPAGLKFSLATVFGNVTNQISPFSFSHRGQVLAILWSF